MLRLLMLLEGDKLDRFARKFINAPISSEFF